MEEIAQLLEDVLLNSEPLSGGDERELQLLLTLARLRGRLNRLPETLQHAIVQKARLYLQCPQTSVLASEALVTELGFLGISSIGDLDVSMLPSCRAQHMELSESLGIQEGAEDGTPSMPFSKAPMWHGSRRFYESSGVAAWSGKEAVPSEATCNAYVATSLARAALAFRRDIEVGCGSESLPHRLVIVDVGAGHAVLTYLLVRALHAEPSLSGKVLVLATDFNRALLEDRMQRPSFAPLLLDHGDDSQLVGVDFAVLDLCENASGSIELLHSRMSLADVLVDEPCCFFFVCCYIFDSLPTDLHLLRRTVAEEGVQSSEIRVHGPCVDFDTPPNACLSWTPWSGNALLERYSLSKPQGKVASTLLQSVAPGQCMLRAVPVGGIAALQRLRSLDCNGGAWAVAVVDEPYDIDDRSFLTELPEITPRPEAFALAVDFGAIEAAFRDVASDATAQTWSSSRALEGLTLQLSASAHGCPLRQLAASLQEGPIGRLSFYDYLIVITVARQIACRGIVRSVESQDRDCAILEHVGSDHFLARALARSASSHVRSGPMYWPVGFPLCSWSDETHDDHA